MTFEEANNHLHNARIGCLIDDKADKDLQKMCVLALEKQIPKKPRETRSCLMCAACGWKITEKGCKKLNRHYCKQCGQAIDWNSGGTSDA